MRHSILALALSSILLSGCATGMGSNIKSDFQCKAPDGTCAPLSAIDAAAVRGANLTTSTMSIDPMTQRAARVPILAAYGETATVPGRTGERVLKVVFPAHIDTEGVFHEPAAVHAVVETPRWSELAAGGARAGNERARAPEVQASAQAVPGSGRGSALAPLDEVIASAAPKAPQPVQQYRSFSPPQESVAAGSVGVTAPVSYSQSSGAELVGLSPSSGARQGVAAVAPARAAALPKINGESTVSLNASSLNRADAEVARMEEAQRQQAEYEKAMDARAHAPSVEVARDEGSDQ